MATSTAKNDYTLNGLLMLHGITNQAALREMLKLQSKQNKCGVPVRIIAMPSREAHASDLQYVLRFQLEAEVMPAWDTRGLRGSDLGVLVEAGVLSKNFAAHCAVPEHGHGAIGCALSHLRAWLELVQSSAERMVVLEDDVHVDYMGLYRELEAQQVHLADYVVLGCNGYYTGKYTLRFGVPQYELVDEPPFGGVATERTGWVGTVNGTQGYIITRAAASKLLKYVLKCGVPSELGLENHIDHLIAQASRLDQYHHCIINPALSKPPCVRHYTPLREKSTRTEQVDHLTTSTDEIITFFEIARRVACAPLRPCPQEIRTVMQAVPHRTERFLNVMHNYGPTHVLFPPWTNVSQTEILELSKAIDECNDIPDIYWDRHAGAMNDWVIYFLFSLRVGAAKCQPQSNRLLQSIKHDAICCSAGGLFPLGSADELGKMRKDLSEAWKEHVYKLLGKDCFETDSKTLERFNWSAWRRDGKPRVKAPYFQIDDCRAKVDTSGVVQFD